MDLSDDDYAKKLESERWKTLADVLGVRADDVIDPKNKNHQVTLKGLRKLIRGRSWVSRAKAEVGELLLDGEIICVHCYETSTRFGVLKTIPTSVDAHAGYPSHIAKCGAPPKAAAAVVSGGASAAAEAKLLTKTLAALMEAAFDAAEVRTSETAKRRCASAGAASGASGGSEGEGEEEEEWEGEEEEEEDDEEY
jgi:hypothetical protein